jgi:hypothetical protein
MRPKARWSASRSTPRYPTSTHPYTSRIRLEHYETWRKHSLISTDVNRKSGRNSGTHQPSLFHDQTARRHSSNFFQERRQILHWRRQAVALREVRTGRILSVQLADSHTDSCPNLNHRQVRCTLSFQPSIYTKQSTGAGIKKRPAGGARGAGRGTPRGFGGRGGARGAPRGRGGFSGGRGAARGGSRGGFGTGANRGAPRGGGRGFGGRGRG